MHTATLTAVTGSLARDASSSISRAASISSRQFDSRTLFGDAQEVRIEHFGQEYRLRQTRNGKLILTK